MKIRRHFRGTALLISAALLLGGLQPGPGLYTTGVYAAEDTGMTEDTVSGQEAEDPAGEAASPEAVPGEPDTADGTGADMPQSTKPGTETPADMPAGEVPASDASAEESETSDQAAPSGEGSEAADGTSGQEGTPGTEAETDPAEQDAAEETGDGTADPEKTPEDLPAGDASAADTPASADTSASEDSSGDGLSEKEQAAEEQPEEKQAAEEPASDLEGTEEKGRKAAAPSGEGAEKGEKEGEEGEEKAGKAGESQEEDDSNYWSIDVVFFDSAVDSGHTPLTSIDWNATSDSLSMLPGRTVRVQITYRNTGAKKEYGPGELTITLPNIMGGQGTPGSSSAYTSNSSHMNWTVEIPANDAQHTGFDWTLENAKDADVYTFTNANSYESNLNFEGTMTLTYTLTSMGEFAPESERANSSYPMDELYQESCTHSVDVDVKAQISEHTDDGDNVLAESGQLDFNFERTYTHPWTRQQYELAKKAVKLTTQEGLGDNPNDYIWVKYEFDPKPNYIRTVYGWTFDLVQSYQRALGTQPGPSYCYPVIGAYEGYITDVFPSECVVLDYNHKNMTPVETTEEGGSKYKIMPDLGPYGDGRGIFLVYVGYPREIYNEENGNLHITNTADLIGKYGDRDTEEVLATGDVSLDLSDFEFVYYGDLFRVDKYMYQYSTGTYHHAGSSLANTYERPLRYQDIINDYNYNSKTWYIRPTIRYPGFSFDMKIGDDFLYSTDLNGNVSRVPDDDYYFTDIHYSPNVLHNTSGSIILTDQYDCELWVRRAGQGEYERIDTFRNGLKTKWTFTADDKVVGFYFVVKDCKEGFTPTSSDALSCTTKFTRRDIPHTGWLHNFSYLEIWKEINGEQVLLNEPGLDSYATDYTQQEIAAYDLENYGHYLQRGTDKVNWVYYDVPHLRAQLITNKNQIGSLVQESAERRFTGKYRIAAGFGSQYRLEQSYIDSYHDESHQMDLVHGLHFYDLLPQGMVLLSDADEIAASMDIDEFDMWQYNWSNMWMANENTNVRYYDKDLNRILNDDFLALCRDHLSVRVVNNWNGTGRTWIGVDVDLSDNPVFFSTYSAADSTRWRWYTRLVHVDYRFSIPYESLEDYGQNFLNEVYAAPGEGDNVTYLRSSTDINDLDGDGSSTERMSKHSANLNIAFISASLQGLTKTVETSSTSYTASSAMAMMDTDYRYRLRVSTGNSKVTDLVIYDVIEGNTYFPDGEFGPAYGDNPHWQGHFRGYDTSYAESQGWQVRVYYSTEEDPKSLEEGTSWQLLTNETDKETVRALAFRFLDRNGGSAVFGRNYNTYVEIKMHSPTEEDGVDTKTRAYNGSWVNWKALDDNDHVIPYVLGIQSNITSIVMNEPTEITVEKEWKADYEDVRPDSVTVSLLADGEKLDEAVLSEDNGWSHTFDQLWKYSDRGTVIEYSVEETEIPEGYRVTYSDGSERHTSATPKAGYYHTVNTYMRKRLHGIKRWDGDNESVRPDSVTILLLQNGREYQTATTDEAHGWNYEFDVDTVDENGQEYVYEVREVVPEGYRASYTQMKDGPVTIRFNSRSQSESSCDYLYIYYWNNGKLYRSYFSGTFPAAANFPVSDLYFYWHSDSSVNRYGFKIDSIESYNGTAYAAASSVTSLPSLTVTETRDLPETGHNYGNSENFLWHYIMPELTVTNEYTYTTLDGIKTWSADDPADRPQSITVHLLQNGQEYKTTVTDAAHEWKYSFSVPKKDDNGNEYEYSIVEDVPEGYSASYVDQRLPEGPVTVRFDPLSRTYNSNDYLVIYYRLNGQLYRTNNYYGSSMPKEVSLPASDLYFYWRSDNNYSAYGFRAASIEAYSGSSFTYAYAVASLPAGTVTETSLLPETSHNYGSYESMLWHYDHADFRIDNEYQHMDLTGVKTWSGDVPEDRPESITVTLLQNGTEYRTTTAKAEDGWKFVFRGVPKTDESGAKYTYEVREDIPEGYRPAYEQGTHADGPVTIHFDPQSFSYNRDDYLYIYYMLDGTLYRAGSWYGKFPESVSLPSADLYFQWHSNSSYNAYGFRVTSIENYTGGSLTYGQQTASLPAYTVTETAALPETGHNYSNYEDRIWHYVPTDFRIINEYQNKDLSGIKIWSGDGEADRPDSITVTLLQNGTDYRTTTTDADRNWKFIFRGVPKTDNEGTEYRYEIREDVPEGYSASYTLGAHAGSPVTIHFDPQSSTFSSADCLYIYYRLDGRLYRAGSWYGSFPESVNLPSADLYFYWHSDYANTGYGFRVTSIEPYSGTSFASAQQVSSIPTYYSVKETWTMPETGHSYSNYEDMIWHYNAEDLVVTNRYVYMTLTGIKTWEEEDPTNRPDSITVKLLQNGEEYRTATTDAAHDWKYRFSVPKADADGNPYTYEVQEVLPPGYRAEYGNGLGTGPVTVRFDEQGRTESTSYDYLEIYYRTEDGTLHRTERYGGSSFPSQISLPSGDLYFYWHTDASVNDYYGFKITEIVKHDGSDFAWSSIVQSLPSGASVEETTNLPESEHDPYPNDTDKIWHLCEPDYMIHNVYDDFRDIDVEKKWVDDSEEIRPETVTVYLLADGERIDSRRVGSRENWSCVFTHLPRHKGGREIVYTVDEESVSRYTKQIESSTESSFTITNTYAPDRISIPVTKVWDDTDDQDGKRPEAVTVHLMADGKDTGKTLELNEKNGWHDVFAELPADKAGTQIEYSVSEDPAAGYTVKIETAEKEAENNAEGSAADSAGKPESAAEAGFIITNAHVPETVTVEGQKTWDDDNDADGMRPASITVILLADGVEKARKETDKAGGWKWKFEDLPKYGGGQEISYTVREIPVPKYKSVVSGYDIRNIYMHGTIEIPVRKVWNGNGEPAESVMIYLYRQKEGSEKEDTGRFLLLDKQNGWEGVFADLPIKDGIGREYTYSIEEEEVPGFITSVTGDQETGFTVTNTYEPPNEPSYEPLVPEPPTSEPPVPGTPPSTPTPPPVTFEPGPPPGQPVSPRVLGAQRGVLGARRGVLGAVRTGDDGRMWIWFAIFGSAILLLVGWIFHNVAKKQKRSV